MIHSHWLCYKYFYGSVFPFLFSFPLFQKGCVDAPCPGRHSRTSDYRRLELGGPFELARGPRQRFTGEEIGARRLRNFLEVTELVPGRLRAGALDF